jgi:TRAP-type C4-dicarboxylate transport system permease small subunit
MPEALESLAVWPVITGMIFILRSLGIAYNEVVVALLGERGASIYLRRFADLLAAGTTLALLIITATPLSSLWFSGITALQPELADMAQRALWLALPLPALSVLQSWCQGAILYSQHTKSITESVAVYLITSLVVLGAGVAVGNIPGLYIGILGLTLSVGAQTIWLWFRSMPVRGMLKQRDWESQIG